jgi:predicted O-methyltransferase YrrM
MDKLIQFQESRFTSPTDYCLHPEWWHSAEDESTEFEITSLIKGLIHGLQPDFCIETGSGFGQTTREIGIALKDNGHGGLLTFEYVVQRAIVVEKMCEGLPVNVVIGSLLESPQFSIKVDFAFFDSSHRDRVPEFEFIQPYLSAGALCVFHDSAQGHGYDPDTGKCQIEKLREIPGVQVINLPTPRGLALVQVVK